MATLVKFRKEIGYYNDNITAVFPQLKYNRRLYSKDIVTAYAHLGQHTSASIKWMNESTAPATKAEYTPLLNELISIGYNLKICK